MARCKNCYRYNKVALMEGFWVTTCSLDCQNKELEELRALQQEEYAKEKEVEEKNN